MKKKLVAAVLLLSTMLAGCSESQVESIVESENADNEVITEGVSADDGQVTDLVDAREDVTDKTDSNVGEDGTDMGNVQNEIEIKENGSGSAEEAVYNLGLSIIEGNVGNTNIMVSPVSIERAMAMALEGADGKTKEEIYAALYGNIPADKAAGLSALYQMNDGEESFVIANSIWTNSDNNITLKKDYSKNVEKKFEAKAESLPFSSSKTVDTINSWVDKNTHGQIPSIIQNLEPEQNVVLVNTTYFKSSWYDEFLLGGDTYDFKNADGTTSNIPAMHSFGDDDYLKINGHDAFKKGYVNGFSYVGILPGESESITDLLKDISFDSIVNAVPEDANLELTFPSYESDYDVNLVDTLKALGINEAFEDSADFSLMCDNPSKISGVLHKTHIKLDEKGTEASAATAVIMAATASLNTAPVVQLTFDRPFVYVILNQNNVPVFMGVVNEVKQ